MIDDDLLSMVLIVFNSFKLSSDQSHDKKLKNQSSKTQSLHLVFQINPSLAPFGTSMLPDKIKIDAKIE